eukprot:TRINITY_DN8834_c0_g1_i1.p1 TRINITY_DN8834_c0_g1~~TRINITY_DN8834_c0_g1_i1.p1  ORF type:complete len:310 (-),score=39.92 TRINITY_DN8834_c0_g1_i1:185-1114(-)
MTSLEERWKRHLRVVSAHLQPVACSAGAQLSQPSRTAEALMAAWSDLKTTRPPMSQANLLDGIETLPQALAVHDHILTSPEVQRLGGLAGWKLGWKGVFPEQHALYGPLFKQGLVGSGEKVSLGLHKVFSAEAEFGLVFGRRLEARSTPYTPEEVWAAVDHVELCIELCSCRHWESRNRLHYVADALLSGAVVRGPSIGKPSDPSKLPDIEVKLSVAGKEMQTGSAKNNPFDAPLPSATFAVNEVCGKRQRAIEKGDILITGHCCQAAFDRRPCPPHTVGSTPLASWSSGDVMQADFAGLGSVKTILME